MKVTIRVTRRDIRQGESECETCPIALAVRRALPGSEPRVDADLVAFGPDRGVPAAWLPKRATRFVWRFDGASIGGRGWLRWLTIRPFRFDLDVPDELVRQP